MLAPKIAVTAGKTTHRFRSSVPHSVLGHVELPLGRSAHPRRVAEARHHRLRTHGVAVYPRPNEGTVAELPDVLRKRVGPVGARLDDDVKQKLVTLIAPSLVLDEFRRLGWISRSLHRSDVRVCSLSARPVRFQSGSPAFVTTRRVCRGPRLVGPCRRRPVRVPGGAGELGASLGSLRSPASRWHRKADNMTGAVRLVVD